MPLRARPCAEKPSPNPSLGRSLKHAIGPAGRPIGGRRPAVVVPGDYEVSAGRSSGQKARFSGGNWQQTTGRFGRNHAFSGKTANLFNPAVPCVSVRFNPTVLRKYPSVAVVAMAPSGMTPKRKPGWHKDAQEPTLSPSRAWGTSTQPLPNHPVFRWGGRGGCLQLVSILEPPGHQKPWRSQGLTAQKLSKSRTTLEPHEPH